MRPLLGAYAFGGPVAQAQLKRQPEDFQVTEDLGFSPDGDGEHLFVWVEKRGANTLWVRRQLANLAGVNEAVVGHSGLKDRQALTRQWFSIQLPGKTDPDWASWVHSDFRVLEAVRHRQKLRPGCHRGNQFRLLLRAVQGSRELIEARLQQVLAQGCPNYFGLQRFGFDGHNLEQQPRRGDRKAQAMFDSAWRAWFFNQLLSLRIQEQTWDQLVPGELVCLNGSNSFFALEQPQENEISRCLSQDVHPSGPLVGRGKLPSLQALEWEQQIQALEPQQWSALEQRQQAARRPLRLNAVDFSWSWLDNEQLQLEFWLPPGAYATVLLREVFDTSLAEQDETAE